ncbi:hypothetical protein FOXG_05414 [Fusarium oxysporum f. sp. lycopersici 4287]|uniref:Period circadian protein n=2 Tax=Fusarium oxysporum TaxID=5507 RepID=A0A0J9USS0_FUSO4|nr:hypothetical protein FOXG_05414 [Fusarium oxysporum f. sp. lycopersici 4287]KAJ9422048.1 hypothetical protein QL093DRAFT_2303876 [Fusarium oxysporum]KNB02634.1 hypothetical protein FOXG_05414 [Fusarium oxysporum f. sp. lycopersici 4287]
MSGLINKVKDAIHSDKDKSHEQPTGTHGPHSSRAANAADPRIDSDRDHRANPGTTTGHHTTTGGLGSTGATGTHSSGLPEGSVGPHSSRAANAADPRVDSDLDSSRRTGATGSHGLSGTTGTTGGLTGGSTGATGTHSSGLPEGSVGPHSSRAANAADPRVDSDLDSSRRTGATGSHGLSGTTGTTGGLTGGSNYSENMPGHTTGGLGHTGGMGRSENLPEGSVGPHSSRVANAADPRVDSDLDSSRRTGGIGATGGMGGNTYDHTTTGTSGFSSHGAGAHGPTGTHTSGLGGTGSTGTYGSTGTGTGAGLGGAGSGYGTGPGPAPNTAGPHKSDALNKADPRVDSDLDGSKTVGKEKTFQQSNNNFAGRDPTDATQVPPSVLQKHVPTEIAHDDPHSDHSRRHSSTHQETHRGL